jgi:hypothetical protein
LSQGGRERVGENKGLAAFMVMGFVAVPWFGWYWGFCQLSFHPPIDLRESLASEAALIRASKDSFLSFGYPATMVLIFWLRLPKNLFL